MSRPGRLSLWAPVVGYMALIFVISSISEPVELPPGPADKGGHALLYAGLAALMVRALAGGWLRPVTPGTAVAAIAITTLYGITDEFHQSFVPGRTMDRLDVVADAVGAALAASVLYLWSDYNSGADGL